MFWIDLAPGGADRGCSRATDSIGDLRDLQQRRDRCLDAHQFSGPVESIQKIAK